MNSLMSSCLIVLFVIFCSASVEAQIADIDQFLERSPTTDPAYAQIRTDFQIRRNGELVGTLNCPEPISAIPIAEYTDELVVVQSLRTLYYMDRGLTGHLPWTSGNLYDWMRARIGGIDIRDGVSGGYCCESFDGRTFIVIGSQNDFNRDFDRKWRGISGNICFYAHEARHVDGFPHSSCCGISAGCDSFYDELNPAPYAVQWILNRLWLEGVINVGIGCLSENERIEIGQWHLGSCNSSFRSRFCTDPPPILSLPALVGGSCLPVPITLSSFSAVPLSQNGGVGLEWKTASETNNYGFIVERDTVRLRHEFVEVPGSFTIGQGTTLVPHTYTFVDRNVTSGRWTYRLKQIDLDGTAHVYEPRIVDLTTTAAGERMAMPTAISLGQNYPNPFNPSTTIRYGLPGRSHVALVVFNTLGQRVSTLVQGEQDGGYHEVTFDAATLQSGVYFYRLQAGSYVETKRLLLVR